MILPSCIGGIKPVRLRARAGSGYDGENTGPTVTVSSGLQGG
ncbi:hypothetical protein [Paenibacillus sp. BJ-4]|nr:hypothetical protein [Paenibacillus sp. BJ-4]